MIRVAAQSDKCILAPNAITPKSTIRANDSAD